MEILVFEKKRYMKHSTVTLPVIADRKKNPFQKTCSNGSFLSIISPKTRRIKLHKVERPKYFFMEVLFIYLLF